MEIYKPNIKYIIHYNMPYNLEKYHEEINKVCKDGEYLQCIILYTYSDALINLYILNNSNFENLDSKEEKIAKERNINSVNTMEEYCLTKECLRNYILNYFGEKATILCKKCGNCNKPFKKVDMTKEAKHVINCINETNGIYNIKDTIKYLKGEKINGLTNKMTYGILKEISYEDIFELINQLIKKNTCINLWIHQILLK